MRDGDGRERWFSKAARIGWSYGIIAKQDSGFEVGEEGSEEDDNW